VQNRGQDIPLPAGFNEAEQKVFKLRFGHLNDGAEQQAARNQDWDTLKDFCVGKNAPTDTPTFKYRNLYIDTHGDPKKIGGDWNVWDPKATHVTSFSVNSERAYLTVDQTKNALGTANVNTGKPYRFVFLDGCETAGGDFPQTFCGKVLPNKETDETFFGDPQNGWYARPRAFVGWKKGKEPVWGGLAPRLGVCKGYIKFRQEFFARWAQTDKTLRQALDEAENTVKDPGVDDDYTWRDPGHPEKRIVWDDGLVVYGDRDLKIEQFNPSPMPQ